MDAFERWELDEQLRHVARVLGPEYLAGRRTPKTSASDDAWSWTDWLAMTVGFCALIVGALLSAGELWGRNANLWRFGLPVALMGLAALAVGLWPDLGTASAAVVRKTAARNRNEKSKCKMQKSKPGNVPRGAQGPGLPSMQQVLQGGG